MRSTRGWPACNSVRVRNKCVAIAARRRATQAGAVRLLPGLAVSPRAWGFGPEGEQRIHTVSRVEQGRARNSTTRWHGSASAAQWVGRPGDEPSRCTALGSFIATQPPFSLQRRTHTSGELGEPVTRAKRRTAVAAALVLAVAAGGCVGGSASSDVASPTSSQAAETSPAETETRLADSAPPPASPK
jgi:hypothetical protein